MAASLIGIVLTPTFLPLLLPLMASGCVLAPAHAEPRTAPALCSLPEADRTWIDRALDAWRFTVREITGSVQFPPAQVVFFSADCVLRSGNALSSPTTAGVTWSAVPHSGEVTLPDGKKIPAGVTSFASGEKDSFYFVMSTPSVWESAGVGKGEDLRKTMVAVLLHESSHLAQIRAYGKRLGALIERNSLPDSFNDDSLQERFGKNPEFTESVKRERELFVDAAAAKDDAEARRLARDGLRLVRQRQARWLVGDDAYFVEAEDIWLTFEGAGQWVAFQWLVDPRGGNAGREEQMARFAGNRWWSQAEGFAVVMALDRIAGPTWKRHAYGDGAQTVLEMLEAVVRDVRGSVEIVPHRRGQQCAIPSEGTARALNRREETYHRVIPNERSEEGSSAGFRRHAEFHRRSLTAFGMTPFSTA